METLLVSPCTIFLDYLGGSSLFNTQSSCLSEGREVICWMNDCWWHRWRDMSVFVGWHKPWLRPRSGVWPANRRRQKHWTSLSDAEWCVYSAMQCSAVQCSTALHYTALHSEPFSVLPSGVYTVQRSAAQHSTALHSTVNQCRNRLACSCIIYLDAKTQFMDAHLWALKE